MSWPPVSLPCITRGTCPVSPGVPAGREACRCESVCAKSLQSCPTLCDPIGCSPSGSSVLGILQASILQWIAKPSSRGSSQPRDSTCLSYVSCIGRWVLHVSELDLNHSSEPNSSSLCLSHLRPAGPRTRTEQSLRPASELPDCLLSNTMQQTVDQWDFFIPRLGYVFWVLQASVKLVPSGSLILPVLLGSMRQIQP